MGNVYVVMTLRCLYARYENGVFVIIVVVSCLFILLTQGVHC